MLPVFSLVGMIMGWVSFMLSATHPVSYTEYLSTFLEQLCIENKITLRPKTGTWINRSQGDHAVKAQQLSTNKKHPHRPLQKTSKLHGSMEKGQASTIPLEKSSMSFPGTGGCVCPMPSHSPLGGRLDTPGHTPQSYAGRQQEKGTCLQMP